VDFRLEVVVVPVSDVDRAKAFYTEKAGFVADHDRWFGDSVRVVQLTPPGSACSIVIGTGLGGDMEPGSLRGLQLVVSDIAAAHAELAGRGVEVSGIQVFDSGSPRPRREGDDLDNVGFVFFRDPDGNAWAVQQIPARE
jgi:catechol 2,3-dioxygenase-like lactoylglutathione lyase family enzyme